MLNNHQPKNFATKLKIHHRIEKDEYIPMRKLWHCQRHNSVQRMCPDVPSVMSPGQNNSEWSRDIMFVVYRESGRESPECAIGRLPRGE